MACKSDIVGYIVFKSDAKALFKFAIEKFIELRDSIDNNYPSIPDDIKLIHSLPNVNRPKLSFTLPFSNTVLNLYPEDAKVILNNLDIITNLSNKE